LSAETAGNGSIIVGNIVSLAIPIPGFLLLPLLSQPIKITVNSAEAVILQIKGEICSKISCEDKNYSGSFT
jgi:hypothetical protein